MAKGIRSSTVVVVCVTSAYLDKALGRGPAGAQDSCLFEYEFAK
jgi:hypothetical protein